MYGEPGSARRQVIVGGFIVEMKQIGMASANDEASKRVQLEAATKGQLKMLESLINYHQTAKGSV